MRKLTIQQLLDAFLAAGFQTDPLSTMWLISEESIKLNGIYLRAALDRFRNQIEEVSVFVEKILLPEDLDDVVYVIDLLRAAANDRDTEPLICLSMLEAWRAKTLMQIVIDKHHQDNQPKKIGTEEKGCD